MIDTVVLTLNQDQFKILDYDKFTPSARGLFEPPFYKLGKNGIIRCHNNPTKDEKRLGCYRPKLTLTKRMVGGGINISLRVEFSVPKLFYGNNFAETTPKNVHDLNPLFDSKSLESMGVDFGHLLEKTSVTGIHFCKNIILPKHITCSMIISELAKLNLTKRLDLNKTDYRNAGHAVKFHANSYEVVFYDKVKDLEQARISEKRTIESDSRSQLHLLNELPKDLQVLRMEVRLNTRRKIKSLCQSLGLTVPETLADVFRKDLAQGVLLHFWNLIERELNVVSLTRQKPENLFQQLITHAGIKPTKALQIIGALSLINSVGMRGLNSMMGKSGQRIWTRLKKELQYYATPNDFGIKVASQIREALVNFHPIFLETAEIRSSFYFHNHK